jgi:hypothetical protein
MCCSLEKGMNESGNGKATTTQRTSHPQHSQVAEGTRDPSLKWKGKFTGSNPVLTTNY